MKTTLLALSCLLATLPAGAAEPPAFDIKTTKPDVRKGDTRISVVFEKDAVVFDIHDVRGIGGVIITPKAGTWPKPVLLRLHLGGLESLEIKAGKVALFASVPSHSGHKCLLEIDAGGKRRVAEKTDPLWARIRIVDAKGKDIDKLPVPEDGGYFEVTLPAALLDGTMDSLTLQWIDFLRR